MTHAPTVAWEHFVARRMSGPVSYVYSAHRIERVDPFLGSHPESLHFRASFRASFGPAAGFASLSFATDYSVGSGIPLHAYVDWQSETPPPDKEPLGRFPRLSSRGHCPDWPMGTSRQSRFAAARKQGPGFTKDEVQIRNVIRRHYLPAAPDVLSALVRDVEGLTGIHSFEDWVDELCIEPPPTCRFSPWLRHWRAAYDRLVSIASPVRAFFGEQWDEACELAREL